jgi:hypothetical protein
MENTFVALLHEALRNDALVGLFSDPTDPAG